MKGETLSGDGIDTPCRDPQRSSRHTASRGDSMLISRRVLGGVAFIVCQIVAARAGAAPPACSSTESVTCGDRLVRSLGTATEMDCFAFSAAANEAVSIATTAVSGAATPCWELHAPDGTNLTGFACGLGTVTLPPQTGVYTIRVVDAGTDQTGTYALSLEPISATFNGGANGP